MTDRSSPASAAIPAGDAGAIPAGDTGSILARAREPDPRLLSIVTLADFEPMARARMHPTAYAYVAGGSWGEETLADNEASWRRFRLRPRVLVDVTSIEPATTLLGQPASMPVGIAPMASHALADPEGEVATARAAAAAGVPVVLSTVSSRTLEEVAEATPDAVRFFQLYTQADPAVTRSLVRRAVAAGYRAIVLTVDLPVLGYRERDRRIGFVHDVPRGNFLGEHALPSTNGSIDEMTDFVLTWDDVDEIRSWSDVPLVLKGILTPEDAALAVEHGAAGIAVSNHGARQLDRVEAPIDALEPIVAAVDGRAEIWVDGGVRRGLDIPIALALGARAVLVGRPIFWALATAGEQGVAYALAMLREELVTTMALLGTPTAHDIGRAHVVRAVDSQSSVSLPE